MSRQSLNFKKLVESYHTGLYRFAHCLTQEAQTASDLVQHTFFIYANKGAEARENAALKVWFYATLYKEYLRQRAAPQIEARKAKPGGPASVKAENLSAFDGESTAALFVSLDEPLRAPVALFYLRALSYREMSEALDLAVPELLQRVATGKNRLKAILAQRAHPA